MSQYQTKTNFATPAANDTAIHIKGSATVQVGLRELVVGSSATPVEQSGLYRVARTTSAGITPVATLTVVKRNTFSPAGGATAEGNGYTTEPTVGDILMDIPLHQKILHRWVAYPGFELLSVPSANNGLGLIVVSQSAAFALDPTAVWLE